MSINLSVPQNEIVDLKPRITVVGAGGAGGNAVNNMINAKLEGVDFVVANTDAQALTFSLTDRRIQLGSGLTQGLGAGSKPEIGRAAAEESIDELSEHLKGSHMVFIAAGMGGGTGTGAAPVIARVARDLGVLTVGVVTKPFHFEGQHRQRIAEKGIEELEQYVDTLIIIPNQNLFRVANEKTTFADAFKMADDVLHSGVRGITDLMVMPGLINLDFADVRSIMSEMGKAMMGTGEAEGERRALDAAEAAISNPLLDDTSMAGANGVLINITGGADMTLFEVDEAANRIRSEVEEDAYIIFGSTFDDSLEGRLRVSVVATGIDAARQVRPQPEVLDVHAQEAEAPKPENPAQTQPVLNLSVAQILTDKHAAVSAVLSGVDEEPRGGESAFEAAPQNPDGMSGEAAPVGTDAPAGMPNAHSEEAFIPSHPPAQARHQEAHVDPMAEAALVNGARSAPGGKKSKGPSLFERVTGGAKSKVSLFGKSKTDRDIPPPTTTQSHVDKTSSAQSLAVQSSAVHARPQPALRSRGSALAEPTLGGLDPEERLRSAAGEDDLLDIPAFLRRQAN